MNLCLTPLRFVFLRNIVSGTDAFLLANFAAPRHKDIVCDLGTGCGIIPMALAKNYQPKQIVGVDIQQQAIEQFQLSIEHSDLEGSITAIHADLKDIAEVKAVLHSRPIALTLSLALLLIKPGIPVFYLN